MASKLRKTSNSTDPAPDYADSLYMITEAVERRKYLIYGKLHDEHGEHCAVGAFFADNPKLALNTSIIDEVAAYNDSIPPSESEHTRRNKVLRWLRWKLQVLAGKKGAKQPT